jgi:hypothetical protein
MAALVKLEVPQMAGRIRSVLHYIGLPVDARSITDDVRKQEGATAAAAVAQGVAR